MLEKEIKSILIDWILEGVSSYEDAVIGAEVPLLSGKRWIDILHLQGNCFHAYEIKSDSDDLSRLSSQIKDLNNTFDFTSVVVSNRYISRVSDFVPKSVGIIYLNAETKEVSLVRKAQQRTKLHKENLLNFIWKQELLSLIRKHDLNINLAQEAHHLRKDFSNKVNLYDAKLFAVESLVSRYKKRFDRFLCERGNKTIPDDLINLSFDDKVLLNC